jgi:hypothetical protein
MTKDVAIATIATITIINSNLGAATAGVDVEGVVGSGCIVNVCIGVCVRVCVGV